MSLNLGLFRVQDRCFFRPRTPVLNSRVNLKESGGGEDLRSFGLSFSPLEGDRVSVRVYTVMNFWEPWIVFETPVEYSVLAGFAG